MEVGWWVLVVIALLLLVAGSLRYDWLLAVWRDRFGPAARAGRPPAAARGNGGVHHAAAHTGHVSPHSSPPSSHSGHGPAHGTPGLPHGTRKRKPVVPRGTRRHRLPPTPRAPSRRVFR